MRDILYTRPHRCRETSASLPLWLVCPQPATLDNSRPHSTCKYKPSGKCIVRHNHSASFYGQIQDIAAMFCEIKKNPIFKHNKSEKSFYHHKTNINRKNLISFLFISSERGKFQRKIFFSVNLIWIMVIPLPFSSFCVESVM